MSEKRYKSYIFIGVKENVKVKVMSQDLLGESQAKEKSKEIRKALCTLEIAYLEGNIDTDAIEKARSKAGVYANTHENRKLGRVGQKYKEGIEEKHPKIKDSLDIDDHDTRLKYHEVKDQHPNLSWEDHKNLAMDLYPKKKQALRAYLDNNDPSKESELKNKYNELESANDYHEKMAKQKYKKANPDYHIAKFDKDHLGYSMTSKSDAR